MGLTSFRDPSREEHTILRRSFDRWGIFEFALHKKLLISEKKVKGSTRRDAYLVTEEIAEAVPRNESLTHMGIMIGRLFRKSFLPSMAGVDLISRISATFPFVTVNRTAEALVLYGRDVMYGSIVEFGRLSGNNTTLIILNEDRIAVGLGIGVVQLESSSHVPDKTIVVKTLVDAGHYLRHEGYNE
jgi:ribosome biogenesis protein Nip4